MIVGCALISKIIFIICLVYPLIAFGEQAGTRTEGNGEAIILLVANYRAAWEYRLMPPDWY
jgi:hypothetical protein